MKPPLFAAVLTPLVSAVLAACATPAPAPSAEVAGSATYRERIMLTPGHVLTVRLEDVSLADAPSRLIAEHSREVGGRAPPYDFRVGYDPAAIDPRRTYAVRAEIRDESGRLRFTTDTRHAVLTSGAGDRVEIVMVGAP